MIAVVGGANVDICGRPYLPPVAGDSNPGEVSLSLGGVGRNIAHDLCLLGAGTVFLTALGEDRYAETVRERCGDLGMDLRRALRVPGGRTSTYLYLCDEKGDMLMAVSDMAICDRITPEYLAGERETLEKADLVIADANIPEASLRYLAEREGPPLFADPVSTRKAMKLKPLLGKIHTLKPNRMEAEALSGVEIRDDRSLRRAAEVLMETGLRRLFVTLGGDGVLAADEHGMERIPCRPARVRDVTGAGDAFMAGLAYAYTQGMSTRESAAFAAAAAALAVECPGTNPPELSPEHVRNRM